MTRKFDFYIIPTPIGNISDISIRAIDILKEVDIIACEDTRTTQKILNNYNIRTKCISYHKYNEKERVDFFLRELQNGKKIGLVSDAGTPLICDPGCVIINELNKHGYSVTSLPGACAITTFISQIPRNGEEFTFIGFIPKSETQIKDLIEKNIKNNIVFYDSPERILKTLKIIKTVSGDRIISLGRELTKLFEEVKTGKISEISDYYKDGIKGEIVCMVYAEKNNNDHEIEYKIQKLKSKGYSDKDISIILSALFNLNKNEIYKKSLEL